MCARHSPMDLRPVERLGADARDAVTDQRLQRREAQRIDWIESAGHPSHRGRYHEPGSPAGLAWLAVIYGRPYCAHELLNGRSTPVSPECRPSCTKIEFRCRPGSSRHRSRVEDPRGPSSLVTRNAARHVLIAFQIALVLAQGGPWYSCVHRLQEDRCAHPARWTYQSGRYSSHAMPVMKAADVAAKYRVSGSW